MKRIDKFKVSEKFLGEDGETLTVSYDNSTNRGYREGVSLHFHEDGYTNEISVFIDGHECRSLRDLLLKLYPVTDIQFTG